MFFIIHHYVLHSHFGVITNNYNYEFRRSNNYIALERCYEYLICAAVRVQSFKLWNRLKDFVSISLTALSIANVEAVYINKTEALSKRVTRVLSTSIVFWQFVCKLVMHGIVTLVTGYKLSYYNRKYIFSPQNIQFTKPTSGKC